jgi:hypothetical protein
MEAKDISGESSRHYAVHTIEKSYAFSVHVDHPVSLFWESGHSFHRVFDGSIVYLAPVPGPIFNKNGEIAGFVEMTWVPKDKNNPCKF